MYTQCTYRLNLGTISICHGWKISFQSLSRNSFSPNIPSMPRKHLQKEILRFRLLPKRLPENHAEALWKGLLSVAVDAHPFRRASRFFLGAHSLCPGETSVGDGGNATSRPSGRAAVDFCPSAQHRVLVTPLVQDIMMEAGSSRDPRTSQRMQTNPLLLVVKEEVVDSQGEQAAG